MDGNPQLSLETNNINDILPETNNKNDIPDLIVDEGDEVELNIDHAQVSLTNSIVDQLKSKLDVGQVVRSVEDAYLLYCKYAHAKGFSVRKGDQRYFPGTAELQAKEFECSCEGVKDEKRSNERIPIYLKPTTRTKCKAKLRITRLNGGEWKVAKFVREHNHVMAAADQRHLLRSSRSISYAKKSTLDAMVNAGISVADAVCYMENETQGSQNLGFVQNSPESYVKKCWIKNARNIIFDEFGEDEKGSGHESDMVFVNQIMRSMHALVIRCKPHEKARNMLTEILDTASKQIDALFENLELDNQQACNNIVHEENCQFDGMLIHDPLNVKSRGITNTCMVLDGDAKSKKRKDEITTKGKGQTSREAKNIPPPHYLSGPSLSSRVANNFPPPHYFIVPTSQFNTSHLFQNPQFGGKRSH